MNPSRRGFLGALLAAAALDPERLLWVPGKKLVSIPPQIHIPQWVHLSVDFKMTHDRVLAFIDTLMSKENQQRRPAEMVAAARRLEAEVRKRAQGRPVQFADLRLPSAVDAVECGALEAVAIGKVYGLGSARYLRFWYPGRRPGFIDRLDTLVKL